LGGQRSPQKDPKEVTDEPPPCFMASLLKSLNSIIFNVDSKKAPKAQETTKLTCSSVRKAFQNIQNCPKTQKKAQLYLQLFVIA
jgi:hypothetical protein